MVDLKVVVAGDVSIDNYYWPRLSVSKGNANWELFDGISVYSQPGGSILLAEMLTNYLKGNGTTPNHLVISQNCNDFILKGPDEILHTSIKLELLPSCSIKKEEEIKKYRVKKYLGFTTPKINAKYPPVVKIKNDDENANVVIIHDAGNGFRDEKDYWPKALAGDTKPIIIYNMYPPLFVGPLWNYIYKNHKEKLILIVNVDDLRKLGANISRSISWEKSARELLYEINKNDELSTIKELNNAIIRFKFEGAVHYKGKKSRSHLYFDPISVENGFWDSDRCGKMRAGTLVFTAVLSMYIINKLCVNENYLNFIGRSIKKGLIKSREFLINGYENYNNNPLIKETYLNIMEINSDNLSLNKPLKSYPSLIECVKLPYSRDDETRPDLNFWTILRGKSEIECDESEENPINLEELAIKIVRHGLSTLKDFPVGKFGKLITVDRAEIESFRSIMNVMSEYVYSDNKQKPLSIAVFGSPGSGKSFGITEIAGEINSEKIKTVLFNLSLFSSPKDLATAFHKVRDISLKGKIPLVFFDEFDSKLNNEELGWIKYFLVPMQDGEFMDCDNMHPIGKAIFVFGGGVYCKYQDFYNLCLRISGTQESSQEKELCHGTSNKCLDFLSRLKGYVNILGPNKIDDQDHAYTIRRAILLRSLIEKNAPNIIGNDGYLHIDESLLYTLIHLQKYIHGIRSMEAMVEMSMLRGDNSWQKASLPPKDQLKLHIDNVDEFDRSLAKSNVQKIM